MPINKTQKDIQILTEGMSELNIAPTKRSAENFIIYLEELKKWNHTYNLTAITDNKDIIIKHFLDSLLYLRFIPAGSWDVCDIGSGAGFPGVPIAIVRNDLTMTLIEPSGKKAAFLRHITRTLSLTNIKILESKADNVRGFVFDIAVTRALFSIERLIKQTWHLVKKNGIFILNKGPGLADEIEHIPAGIEFEVVIAALPFTSIKRNMVKIIKK
jgi:16S rRNA (guanine527-N7)-methyltransferase